MLSDGEIEVFVADGFVPIRQALSTEIAEACAAMVWEHLAREGMRREDPSTWTEPVVWLPCPQGGPSVDAGTAPRLWEAYDQLVGRGRWGRSLGVGGHIPVRFPSEADPGYAGWHIESGIDAGDGTKRSIISSPTRALFSLFLFTDVGELDAPTLVLRGSHLDVAAQLAPAGDGGLEWSSVMDLLPPATFGRETVPATGAAGDVFICHPFLVHRASWPHRGVGPRVMAQPSIWLKEPFALADERGAAPVERAIFKGSRH